MMQAARAESAGNERRFAASALTWSARLLVAASWLSAGLFGAYILAFYGGALRGSMETWNSVLPRLYEPDTPRATIAMGAHFLTGGILLILGPIQLIGGAGPLCTAGSDEPTSSRPSLPGRPARFSFCSKARWAGR